jgi:NAD(P)-dependent dehydrogenase (short-subunit alcohol dehydrogenase family)
MVKTLAVELAPKNIRVNLPPPGYVMTEVTKRGMSNPEWRGYRINLKVKPIGIQKFA